MILPILASIPRPVLLLFAASAYGVIVRWRFAWPMLLDWALIGLLIERPSIAFAVFVSVVMLLRHVPTLAAAFVTMLRLDQFDGWTAHVILFVLPALRAYMPLMSNVEDGDGDQEQVVSAAVTIRTVEEQPIVTPNNEYNGNVSDSARIQFEERARTIAELYEAGMVSNLSKAVCRIYGCSVQSASKTDSTYQLALRAVQRQLSSNKPQFRQANGATAPATYPVTKETP